VIVIKRRSGKDVALIAADELWPHETVHLLRSPKNAHDAFLDALEQSSQTTPSTQ